MHRTEAEFCRQQAEDMHALAKQCTDRKIREQIDVMAKVSADRAAAKGAQPKLHTWRGDIHITA